MTAPPDAPPAVDAFHGTEFRNRFPIVREGFKPGSDEKWFGRGCYFFIPGASHRGPEADAEAWAHFWGKKKGWKAWVVIKATVSLENHLDLTVTDNMAIFNEAREILYRRFSLTPKRNQSLSDASDAAILKELSKAFTIKSVRGNVYIKFVRENEHNLWSVVPNVTVLCVYDHESVIDKKSVSTVREGKL